jgi:hypothetical protein
MKNTDTKIDEAIKHLTNLAVGAAMSGHTRNVEWLDDAKTQLRRARFHERENYQRWQDAQAILDRLGIRPWRPEDGDSRCQQCGRPNVTWFAPHTVWNGVMGSEAGILCPTCFAHKADEWRGQGFVWRLSLFAAPQSGRNEVSA